MSAVTIKEVAARSGVGIATVSRVLNNSPQISEETKARVMKVIEELHYVPNVNGKRLSSKRSHVIAVLVPVIDHPFFAKLISCLEKEADERGYSLLVVSSQHRIEKENEILTRLRRNEADGALFVTHYEHKAEEFKDLAIVSIDRHLSPDIPYVTTDNYEATKKGVEYLIEKGCKKIVYVGTKPSQESEVSLREKAYLDVMKEHGLKPALINKEVNHGQEGALIDELFSEHKGFDAIFASGCTIANILYNRLTSKRIEVPNELEIVSYDGEFLVDNTHHFTTLEQPIDEMAKRCIELLIKIINKEKDIQIENKFNCEFIKGESTK